MLAAALQRIWMSLAHAMTSAPNAIHLRDVHAKGQDSLRCSRCMKPYQEALWTSAERHRHKKFGASVVCKHCRRLGFHPRDLEGYTCLWCRGTFGALAFSRKRGTLYVAKQELLRGKSLCKQCQAHCFLCRNCLQVFDLSRLRRRGRKRRGGDVLCPDCGGGDMHRRVTCIACTPSCDDRLPCAKCQKAYVSEYWSPFERELSSKKGAPLVCKDCSRNGFHQKDLQTFQCQACSCCFGVLMFSRDCIARYRQTNTVTELVCRHCEPRAGAANRR